MMLLSAPSGFGAGVSAAICRSISKCSGKMLHLLPFVHELKKYKNCSNWKAPTQKYMYGPRAPFGIFSFPGGTFIREAQLISGFTLAYLKNVRQKEDYLRMF